VSNNSLSATVKNVSSSGDLANIGFYEWYSNFIKHELYEWLPNFRAVNIVYQNVNL